MVFDLKPQKFVNGGECRLIHGCNSDAPAALDFFILVTDFRFKVLQHGNARRSFAVRQHWSIEISVAEHLRDVSEMFSDLVAAFRVARVVGGYFNRAAVRQKAKTMRRFLM